MATKDAADTNQGTFLIRIIRGIGGSIATAMPGIFQAGYGAAIVLFPKIRKQVWDGFTNELVAKGLIEQDTADNIKDLSEYQFPWGNILPMLAILQVKMADLKAQMEIYSLDRQYDTMAQTTPHPAPIDNLVRSMIIDPKRATENRAELKKHGYNDLQIDNIILSYYRTTDEGTLKTQFLRGYIDEAKLYERMRELGYTDTRSSEIIKTWKVIPGPQDLFYMVAKEAFEPDIYRTLGLDEEFPSEQTGWLEAAGISEEWARKYWIAHWDQPSIGQGFEMLHRGVIGNDTLDMLFRAIEMPSFWRDKLTQIAYNPYTRVDVRRMHGLGVLTDEELIRSYMDQGYDSEKALKMANFTIRFNAEGEAQLSRSAILESYREDLLSHSEAMELLTDQDYSNELAEYYLELENFRRDKKIREQHIDNLRDQYLLNQLSTAQVRDELNRLDLRGEKVTSLMDTWDLDKYKYASIPSKSDLDNFLVKGIITEGQYRNYMNRHGFTSTMITWYIQDLVVIVIEKVRKPTKGNLDEWLQKKIITESEYQEEMSDMGYSSIYIERFILAEGKQTTRSILDGWLKKGAINENEYRNQMADLGYTTVQIGLFIHTQGKITTKTNLDEWLKKNIITQGEYQEQMIDLGYSMAQIGLFIKSKGQTITKTNLDEWLTSEVITQNEYSEGMSRLGYTTVQIQLFIRSKGRIPSRANLDQWFTKFLINEIAYREGMTSLGYKTDDINLFLKSLAYVEPIPEVT